MTISSRPKEFSTICRVKWPLLVIKVRLMASKEQVRRQRMSLLREKAKLRLRRSNLLGLRALKSSVARSSSHLKTSTTCKAELNLRALYQRRTSIRHF